MNEYPLFQLPHLGILFYFLKCAFVFIYDILNFSGVNGEVYLNWGLIRVGHGLVFVVLQELYLLWLGQEVYVLNQIVEADLVRLLKGLLLTLLVLEENIVSSVL